MNWHGRIDTLVDSEKGLVSRELFVDGDLFHEEMENLFTRAWLFVGHESQVPNPGDFFTSRMGTESVILCRDRQHKIHVFLNSCRHRGMKVCTYDEGNTATFLCPYHAWSYGLDGRLAGVPRYRNLYEGVLDRDENALVEVPRLTNYKGTVWASWDPDAPDFLAYLGDAKAHLDLALDCRDGREGGSEVFCGVQKWLVPANWKFGAENFLGDTYHNEPSHQSVEAIGIGPSARSGAKGRRDDDMAADEHVWVSFPQGHGVHSSLKPAGAPYIESFKDDPKVEAYFRHCHSERQRRLGAGARLTGFTGTIFPNTSYHARQPRALCVWHPHGPTTMEIWRFFLIDKDAPAEVKDFMRHYYMRYSGPAGMTEQDDLENWQYATKASQGPIARRHPYNYQQSIGASRLNHLVQGRVSTQISEQNPRGYYRRWADYMAKKDWPALLGRDDPWFTGEGVG